MFCENCGSELPEGSEFCGECGTRIEPDTPVNAQDKTSAPPQQPVAPPPPAANANQMGQQAPNYAQQPVAPPQQPVAPPPPAAHTNQMNQQAPNYSPQSTGYYGGQQPIQRPQPPKKSPVVLIIIIVAAVVLVGVGAFFGIRALIGNDDSAPVEDASPTVTEGAISPPEEEAIPDPEPLNPFEDFRGYKNSNEVSIGDFFWFTEDVKWGGLPADRTTITDFNEISGFWKAYTETIPMSQDEGEYLQWFNAEISGDADEATFTYHTKGFFGSDMGANRSDDISGQDGEYRNGSFSGDRLIVGDIDSNGEKITIKEFYTLDSAQYAVGEITFISGEKEHIALVRP